MNGKSKRYDEVLRRRKGREDKIKKKKVRKYILEVEIFDVIFS